MRIASSKFCISFSFNEKGFSLIFLSESNFRDFLFASMDKEPSQKKSTLQGKNLLLLEQIFSFKN